MLIENLDREGKGGTQPNFFFLYIVVVVVVLSLWSLLLWLLDIC